MQSRPALCDERYPVNLGNPVEMSILDFAQHIKGITGSNAPIQRTPLPEDDPKRHRPDISKAKAVLGWEPRVGLEEGLRQTIDYFRGLS